MIVGKRSERTNGHTCAVVLSLLIFLFPLANTVSAQDTVSVVVRQNDSVPATLGRTVVVPEEHSATKALLLSLLPGAGQVYNGQAWKVPVIYGSFAAMGYFIYYNYDLMSTFKDEYLYRVNHGDTPRMADYASYPTSSIYRLYDSYDRDFQLMVIITAGIYALNLIDAYVFGHLYDFRIDDDLSLAVAPSVTPTPMGFHPSLGVSLRF